MTRPLEPREWKGQAYQLFEYEADSYHAGRERQQGFQAQMAIVLTWLAGHEGRILDIGCASGSAVQSFRDCGFKVLGMDFSPAMLAFARQRFSEDPGAQFCRGDTEFLPFAAKSFDYVTCLGVLEYLPDYVRAAGEIASVLRPGGMAIFSIPSRISPYHIAQRFAEVTVGPVWRGVKRLLRARTIPSSQQVPRHSRNLCIPWRFRRLLAGFGLHSVESAYSNFFVFPLDRFWPSANLRLAAELERFSGSPLLGWTASQYLVAAQKRVAGTGNMAR